MAAAIGAGIGALAGLLKAELFDKPREARQRQLAATTTRLSPFTGLSAQPIQEADPIGSALQGGFKGFQTGQEFAAADRATANNQRILAAIEAQLGIGGSAQALRPGQALNVPQGSAAALQLQFPNARGVA